MCGLAWALALKLPFERLISIDLILYGSSLLLEFVALVVLRIREPNLERPFKAGNLAFACLLGVGPAALIGYALYVSRDEKIIGTTSALLFAAVVGLLGPVLLLAHGRSGWRGERHVQAPARPRTRICLTHRNFLLGRHACFALFSWNCLAECTTWSRA